MELCMSGNLRSPVSTVLVLCAAAAGTLEVGYAQEATPTLTTIYSFGTSATDGVTPISLIRGDKGVLYGVTAYGGTFWGTIFRLTPPAAGQTNWTEKILHTFTRTATTGGSLQAV